MNDRANPVPGNHVEAHVPVESTAINAVDVLQQATGLPKQRIKLAMTQGAVWLTRGRETQRLRRAKRALQPGDELHLYYDAAILAETPPDAGLVADVGGYSVWSKPRGMWSQGSKWGDHCTLVRWAERHLQPERSAYTVHRLDRAASGLMLVAHSKKITAALSNQFAQREIDKCYRALVVGNLSAAKETLRITQCLDEKEAISNVSFLHFRDDSNRSLVDVQIETGRKHQVRRHLAGLGYPIAGDRLYGAGEADETDLQLTAYLLSFHCPVSDKRVEYRLPIADDGVEPIKPA